MDVRHCQVIAHFTSRRIGRVTCRILEEIRAPPSGQQPRGHGGEVGGAAPAVPMPLLDVVEVVPGAPAAVSELLNSMLGGWGLVPDAQAALAAQAPGGSRVQPSNPPHQRTPNLVTYCGAVFKADGEIVAQDAAGGGGGGGSGVGLRDQGGAVNSLAAAAAWIRDHWVRAGPGAANLTGGGGGGGSGEPPQAVMYSVPQDVRLAEEEPRRVKEHKLDEMRQRRESLQHQRCEAHTAAA
ncbi:hypothetical protein Vafri_12669, partial [Volvox africanus]